MIILLAGRWGVRMLATPVPDPDPDDVVEVAVDYRCPTCGLTLTITRAQDEEIAPPRHCREPMELF